MRCGHDPDVDLHRARCADREDLAGLERAQQLGLKRRRQVADLVEQDRSPRRLHQAAGALADPRRDPLLDPEEFRLEQLARHGRAVDRDEGPGASRGEHVDPAREELLAGTGLADQQDRQRADCETVHFLEEVPAGIGGEDELRHLRRRLGERDGVRKGAFPRPADRTASAATGRRGAPAPRRRVRRSRGARRGWCRRRRRRCGAPAPPLGRSPRRPAQHDSPRWPRSTAEAPRPMPQPRPSARAHRAAAPRRALHRQRRLAPAATRRAYRGPARGPSARRFPPSDRTSRAPSADSCRTRPAAASAPWRVAPRPLAGPAPRERSRTRSPRAAPAGRVRPRTSRRVGPWPRRRAVRRPTGRSCCRGPRRAGPGRALPASGDVPTRPDRRSRCRMTGRAPRARRPRRAASATIAH